MQSIVISLAKIVEYSNELLLVFTRVAAIFSIAPIIGSRLIAVRIRVISALLITMVIFPTVPNIPDLDLWSGVGVLLLLEQLLIGLGIGFLLQMAFNAATIAGEVIAMTMGLGFAQMVDPQNGIQVPVVSQLYVIISTLLFIGLNGHIILIESISHSFQTLPLAGQEFALNFVWELLNWASRMFLAAMTFAMPIIAGLLITNMTMGVIARSAPQLNIFAVGFPVTMLIGFVLILLSIPIFATEFERLLQDTFLFIHTLLRIN